MTDGSAADQHALVVGGSSGIGFALADRLIKEGKVTALARRVDNMAALQSQGALTCACDVTHLDSIEKVVLDAVSTQGKITSLIYCAGQQLIKPLRMSGSQHVQAIVGVNLLAPLEFARLFASRKTTSPDAVFCTVSSVAAQRPEPGILTYSSTKAAQEALIKGMARELAPKRAVGVAPGWLETEMTRSLPGVYSDEFKQDLKSRSPLGIATVDSIVDTIAFLIGPKAGYITGQIVTVDGGVSI